MLEPKLANMVRHIKQCINLVGNIQLNPRPENVMHIQFLVAPKGFPGGTGGTAGAGLPGGLGGVAGGGLGPGVPAGGLGAGVAPGGGVGTGGVPAGGYGPGGVPGGYGPGGVPSGYGTGTGANASIVIHVLPILFIIYILVS